MKKIMNGIVILAGIVFISAVLTACSSDSVFVKKNKSGQTTDSSGSSVKEDYSYDDGTEYADTESGYKNKENNSPSSHSSMDKDKYEENDSLENDSYFQKGNASWYGREFHGRKTASGEKYDMNKLTAAHKELPFGTKILVKNMENDKEVSVIINDRGPYRSSRILDLSYAAAKKIGIIGSGEGKVGIKIIKKDDAVNIGTSESSPDNIEPVFGKREESNYVKDSNTDYDNDFDQRGNFNVQAGAFYSRKNAEKFQKKLESIVEHPIILINDNDMYKVRVDKITTRKDADRIKKLLKKDDIHSYVVENQ